MLRLFMLVTSVISVKLTIYKIHTLSENYLSICLSIYICIYLFYTKRHRRSVKSMDLTKLEKFLNSY